MDLTDIGMTQEELQERVVEHIADRAMNAESYDEDGYPCRRNSQFARDIEDAVQEAIDAKVEAIAEEHIIPQIGKIIDEATLRETNCYGEPKGEPMTFTEYFTSRCNDHLTEKVDHHGDPSGRYDKGQTRLMYLVDKHLRYQVETSAKELLEAADEKLLEALKESLVHKMEDIAKSIKVHVNT